MIFAIIFLIIGAIAGFVVNSLVNKEGETVVELKGDSIVSLNVGANYTEAGFTFIINDVDYSTNVEVLGTVDVNEEGTYVLKYVLEQDGHNIELTRIVTVVGGVSDGE